MNEGSYAVVISSIGRKTSEQQLNSSKSDFNMNFKLAFVTPNLPLTATCYGHKQASYK